MYKNVTHRHPQHTVCAGVSSVTKDVRTARCAVVSCQWAGGAIREGVVLFSVFFIDNSKIPNLESQPIAVDRRAST
jgi:hypothetical protein